VLTFTITVTPTKTFTRTPTPTPTEIGYPNPPTATPTEVGYPNPPTPTPTPTVSCPEGGYFVLLTSAESLKVGDTVTVTAMNDGCNFEFSIYSLDIRSDGPEAIFGPNPPPVYYKSTAATIEFELTAVASGQATLYARVEGVSAFEVGVYQSNPLIITVAP
jgi:hypothetical protein